MFFMLFQWTNIIKSKYFENGKKPLINLFRRATYLNYYTALPYDCTHGFPTKWITHDHESLNGERNDIPCAQKTAQNRQVNEELTEPWSIGHSEPVKFHPSDE